MMLLLTHTRTQVLDMLPELTAQLKKAAGHSRVLGISAASGERVAELMQRVRKLVSTLSSAHRSFTLSVGSSVSLSVCQSV